MSDPLGPGCGCDDCEAAVSPGAYLATLLDYAVKHVTNASAKIDLPFLDARFRQPFSRLPIDCALMTKQFSEVRLVVEVLREYLGARPLFEADREAKLAAAEAEYRLAAYTQLLTQLGSSYAEIRQARANGAAERAALADRLGVDLIPPQGGLPRHDALDELFLDPAAAPGDPTALTERNLERLFGLADTTRERLSEGTKYGDAKQQFTRWSIDGAEWDRNTDSEGLVHLELQKLDATTCGVRVFSDAARTTVVASGERHTDIGSIRLSPVDGSGVSGVVEVVYQADEVDVSVSVVPSFQVWRLRRLRASWLNEDAAAAAAGGAPVIDPQVIALGDLASPKTGAAAYDVWLARTKWLDDQRAALVATRAGSANPLAGVEAIVAQALSTPGHAVAMGDLDALDAARRHGQRIEAPLGALGLDPAGFGFLLSIRGMAKAGQPIMDLEWAAVYDTLQCARKKLAFAEWRDQERALKLAISPQFFRASDDAPDQATSPAIPFWLSTGAARRSWRDALDARIAQQADVAAAMQTGAHAVEAAALPLLRDALIGASDAVGDSLNDRADWLARELLSDFRVSGSQRTTRVAHSIETLQELLFGLRTGQLGGESLLDAAPLESIFAVPQGAARVDLVGRGSDDVLWHRVWDGTWRSWVSLGPLPGAGVGSRPSNPVAVAYPDGRLDVVVRGADRVLWQKRYQQGWGDWARVADDLELTGNFTIATRAAGRTDVFALRIGDLQVMQRHGDGATWTAWEDTGARSTRTPASASLSADRVDLVLSRSSPDLFKPTHRWFDGGVWHEEPLDNTLFSDPVAVSWGANRLDVFQNFAGHLWQKSWAGAWGAWVDLDAASPPGAPKLSAPPAAYSTAPDTLEIFGLRGGRVCRRHFAGGAWSDWEEVVSDRLALDAPEFDAEWEWLGSYSSYRSATFVRLYPENLLLPSLITHQSPAFARLVEASRPTKSLSPDDACRLAQKYGDYLRDLGLLDVRATCQAVTRIQQNEPCRTAAVLQKNLCYLFARGKFGNMHWSAWDPSDESGYAQSFWDAVPLGSGDRDALKLVDVIGALPWIDRALGQHHIYVFIDVEELGVRKLKRLRFDLDRFGREPWEPDSTPLSLPTWVHPDGSVHASNFSSATVLPVQDNSSAGPPRLAIRTPNYVYVRPLNPQGDDWDGGGWDEYRVQPLVWDKGSLSYVPDKIDGLDAALRAGESTWLVYRGGGVRQAYCSSTNAAWYVGDGADRLRGALPGSSDASIFLFHDEDGQSIYRQITKAKGRGTAFLTSAAMTTLARHSGSFSPFFFVMQKAGDYGPTYAYQCRVLGEEIVSSFKFQAVPRISAAFSIPCGGEVSSLQARRSSIKSVYDENKNAAASILAVLAEAYRLVPLQLGLNMQASGQHRAALDWFLTVYDYRAAQGQRFIDYGLAIDAGLPEASVFLHPEDWLLDPLNPHAIALTRRLAQTRFVIATIARCFNEFGDAEFTTDTAESLVRARLLYTAAIELCDTPEMQQRLGACAGLIAALQIAPGELVPPEVAAALGEIVEDLTVGKVGASVHGLEWLSKMKATVMSGKGWATIIPELKGLKTFALHDVAPPITAAAVHAGRNAVLTAAYSGLLTDPAIEKAAKLAGRIAVARAAAAAAAVEG